MKLYIVRNSDDDKNLKSFLTKSKMMKYLRRKSYRNFGMIDAFDGVAVWPVKFRNKRFYAEATSRITNKTSIIASPYTYYVAPLDMRHFIYFMNIIIKRNMIHLKNVI